MPIRGSIDGLDVVVSGLENFGPRTHLAALQGVMQGLKVAFEASKAMISADDHTLKELAEMGHPYSKANPQEIHSPDEVVHTHEGDYLRALTATPPVGTFGMILEGRIDMSGDEAMQERDRWIQDGTLTMRPRPWVEKVVEQHGDDIADIVQMTIDEAIAESGAA